MTAEPLLPVWLERRARTHAQHPALVEEGRSLTYAELAAEARRTAGRLRRLGVRAGDRVAIVAENSASFAGAMHALGYLGAVLVPLDGGMRAEELAFRLKDSACSLLLYPQAAADVAASLAGHWRMPRACLDGEGLPGDPALPSLEPRALPSLAGIDLEAVHSIVYTSGTGGVARGFFLTWGNHLWSAVGSAFHLGVRPDDRWLACLPPCHVGGLAIFLRAVLYGTTVVLQRRFDPGRVHDLFVRERVTLFSCVPTMLRRLLEVSPRAGFLRRLRRQPARALRCILVGGGPLPEILVHEALAAGLPIAPTYGMTQTASQIATLRPHEVARRPRSVGQPLLCCEVRIVGPNGEVTAGTRGRIHVRGRNVSPAAVGDRQRPHRPDGWLETGDVGWLDEEGYLYVSGRADEVIITGGENVDPLEVEQALSAHPAVAECCVYGLPDPEWGNIVAASVVLRRGRRCDGEELRRHVRSRLAAFKAPRAVRFVEDLPRSSTGKPLRRRIQAEHAAERGRR